MDKIKRRMLAVCAIAAAVCLLGIAGCEISDSDNDSSSDLRIAPTSVNIDSSASTNVVFSATGGTPPYAWSVNDAALGTLVASGTTAIYTSAAAAGNNFVTVTDAVTNSFSATIVQY